jgi:hypothetical protein
LGPLILIKTKRCNFLNQLANQNTKHTIFRYKSCEKNIFLKHNFWRLHGLNKLLGTFVSKKPSGALFHEHANQNKKNTKFRFKSCRKMFL